jgi:hypothetical protein
VADGEWVPIRYSIQRKSGGSHAVRTGIITAGVAAVFWPAAPVMLLMKGKDVVLNKGITFEIFTDNNHELGARPADPSRPATEFRVARTESRAPNGQPMTGTATIVVTSAVPGADIELDGSFVGNTPATLQVEAGSRRIVVKDGSRSWLRTVQITGGSTVSLNAAKFESTSDSVVTLGIERR